MKPQALIDAGPLVAILNKHDKHHATCREVFASFKPPFATCWPVITEAIHLLQRNFSHQDGHQQVQALLTYLTLGLVVPYPLPASFMTWLEVFFSRFDDKRHQLADAGLAYLAETNGIETVLTLDSDFSIYRIHDGRTRLNVIPPQSTG